MFINGIEVIDSFSFGVGFMFCMIADLIFSLSNFLLEKSLELRKFRKLHHQGGALYMGNTKVMSISVPAELYAKLTNISISFQSDLNSDMVHLMECYVDSYQKLHADAAVSSFMEV